MRVTQKDIARELNLSQSLVAGVLNGRAGLWVSQENRDRIVTAARDMNYQPNAAARALRRGKTGVVAYVSFQCSESHPVIEALAESVAEAECDLLVKTLRNPDQAQEDLRRLVQGGACDIVLLWGLEQELEKPAEYLAQAGMPFILKGYYDKVHPEWMQIEFHHEAMMARAVQHLGSQGHRRIAYIGYQNAQVYTGRLRQGYEDAMRDFLNQPPPERYIGRIEDDRTTLEDILSEWDRFPPEEQPTAIVVGTGHGMWLEIEARLARAGRRIGYQKPDLALAGMYGMALPLLFGEGHGYTEMELVLLAKTLGQRLLLPFLQGNVPEQRVVRVLPELLPLPSLKLPLTTYPRPAIN